MSQESQTVAANDIFKVLGFPQPPTGVWVAYYFDWSSMAVFPDELSARRYAMDDGRKMEARYVEFGTDFREATHS